MFLLRPVRYLLKALAAEDSPRQLAGGFALGLVAGLIPKSSLLAQLALVVLALLQVNLAAGYGAAALFTFLSPLTDPLAHRLGAFLLVDLKFLSPLWTFLYNLPLVPWTAFNNTVVLGSFVLGLLLAYPAYRASEPAFSRTQAALGARVRKLRIVQLLLGADIADRLRPGGPA